MSYEPAAANPLRIGVVRQVAVNMVEMIERFFEQSGNMAVVNGVEDLVPFAAGAYQPDSPQFGQMVGDSGRGNWHLLAQLIDAVLIICQQKNDLGSRRIAQGFEYFDDIR